MHELQNGSNFNPKYEVICSLKSPTAEKDYERLSELLHKCNGLEDGISNMSEIGNQEAIFRSKSKPALCGRPI